MKLQLTALSVAACLFAATAHAETAPGKNECLFARQPSSWQVLDKQQLVLWGPVRKDAYLVTLFSPMNDLKFALSLALVDDDNNGMICGNGSDKIAVPGALTDWPTTIKSMTKLDEAQLLALSEQYKVKLLPAKRLKDLEAAKPAQ